jgi:hypothetical protein
VVGQTIVVANQDCDSQRRKANLSLKLDNTWRSNLRLWKINLKPSLPKYPTCVVTMGLDLEIGLQGAERRDINTLRKLMPIGG